MNEKKAKYVMVSATQKGRQIQNWKVGDKVFERVSSFKYLGNVINKDGRISECIKDRHILCSKTFFNNRAVCEIMWKNMVELFRPQVTVWRMRNACWIPKATNTHSEHVILTAFLLQQRSQERNSVLRYTKLPALFNVISCGIYTTWQPLGFGRLTSGIEGKKIL